MTWKESEVGSLLVLSSFLCRDWGVKFKGKIQPKTVHEIPWGRIEVRLYSFFNLGARWGVWSTHRPGRFTSRKDPVPIVQEAGLAPGTFWTGAKNLAPTGIRSTDRPARSETLYWLNYRGPVGTEGKSEKLRLDCLVYLAGGRSCSGKNTAWDGFAVLERYGELYAAPRSPPIFKRFCLI